MAATEHAPVIREPLPEEMEEFLSLRWKVMRKPLGMERGSEVFEKDRDALHLALFENEAIVAEATAYQSAPGEITMSHLAVQPESRGNGYGAELVNAVEERAQELGLSEVILDAREDVVGFYEKLGYKNHGYEKSFADIKHFRMTKEL